MPRLLFAADLVAPDPDPDPEPLPRGWRSYGSLLGGPKSRRTPGRRVSRTALLADPDLAAPVRDLDGLAVWRVRVASQDEMTCTQCGETTDTGRCYRCGADLDDFDGIETPMVPTLSYLKPGEYDLIRRSWS